MAPGPWYRRSFVWEVPLVAALGAFMLWVRMLPAKTMLFGARAYYVGTDPFYHYRETLGIVRAFPRVPRFDPWTFYPYGTPTNQFGTLFDWLVAAYIVATEGTDASEAHVARVLGVYPAILGALIIVPFYLLAKRLLGTAGAVVASVALALLPGEFLVRTSAGYPDHHVAEALAALFTILAVWVATQRAHAARDAIRARDWRSPLVRRALLFGILGGVALGLNFYVWPPAILFLGILTLWVTIVVLVESARGRSALGYVAGAATSFVVAAVMMVPVLESSDIGDFNAYGPLQIVAPLAAALWLLALHVAATALHRRRAPGWILPSGVAGLVVLVLGAAFLLAERFVGSVLWGLSWVTGFGARHTVTTLAEASPTRFFCAEDATSGLCLASDFGIVPAVTFLLLFVLGWWTIKHARPSDILLLVWSIVIFRAADTQVRFSYYLALNMALLLGWAAARIAEWTGLERRDAVVAEPAKAKGRRAQVAQTRDPAGGRAWQRAAVAAVILLVLPGNVLAGEDAQPVWEAGVRQPDANQVRWLEGLEWMRANTPDAGVDLGLIAERPPPGRAFDQPPSAYGVLSWADYGHWIESVAHRPAVSNPFQQAAPFASLWLTETDPAQAERMLDEWVQGEGPVRYVWIDDQMATGKYAYITVWAHELNASRRTWDINAFTRRELLVNGTTQDAMQLDEQYTDSMLKRLYKDDARGLGRYRLVYEHPAYTTIGSVIYDNGDQRCVNVELPTAELCPVSANASVVQQWRDDPTRAVPVSFDNNVYDVDVYSRLKLFERVPGARLVGTAAPDASVTAEVAIEVRQPDGRVRAFTHAETTRAGPDGAFSIVFPYPTTGSLSPADGGTRAIANAVSAVTVRAGATTATVDVPERAVIDGAQVSAGALG